MKILKSALALFLTLAVVAFPTACGDGGDDSTSSSKRGSKISREVTTSNTSELTPLSSNLSVLDTQSAIQSSLEISLPSSTVSSSLAQSISSLETINSSQESIISSEQIFSSSSSEQTSSEVSQEQSSETVSVISSASSSSSSSEQSSTDASQEISTEISSEQSTSSIASGVSSVLSSVATTVKPSTVVSTSVSQSVYVEPACAHELAQTNTVNPTTTTNGRREFECTLCQDTFSSVIPKLNSDNYTVTEIEATCESEGVITYSSNIYGTFTTRGEAKLKHSAYRGDCIKCGKTLCNNLDFDQNNAKTVSNVGAGPRMLELQNGDFLVAFDDGTNNLMVTRSSNKGETWSEPYIVDTVDPKCLAANTSLYQFENGDVLCAYRVHGDSGLTGSNEQKYVRKIICAVSKDNGYTWSYHSTIVDVYQMGLSNSKVNSTIESLSSKWVGVYEPCFGEIDGKLTVMYADDFSSKIKQGNNDHGSQLIQSCTWDPVTETWSAPNTCLDGTVKKSVNGYNVISRDGMPVFDELSDGTVVLVTEGTYMNGAGHPFIICLSYSKDKGKTFSTPKAIFIPRKDKAKGAAPYVCVTDDDRLIVSYQTDEDLGNPGYDDPNTPNLNEADAHSIMKVIISDGTPIDKITGPENFLDSVNVFGTPRNYGSSWNGMMLSGDTIYCLTGTDWNMNGGYGIRMQSAKVPAPSDWLQYPSCADEIYTRNGSVSINGNWITTTATNSLATLNTEVYNGTVSVDVVPNTKQDVALIFRANPASSTAKFWETGVSYYLFMVNAGGEVFIAKINNGWTEIITSQRIRNTYDPLKGYSLKVELNNDVITCYLDGEMILSLKDENALGGSTVGIRAAQSGAMFCNLTAKAKSN